MNISVLGATGSIGKQTLDVVRTVLPQARVCVLSGHRNITKLAEFANEFAPDIVSVPDEQAAEEISALLTNPCEILTGTEGLSRAAAFHKADVVVNALVGCAGLEPTLSAINAGKNVALANKETLVTAGELVMKLAREKGVRLTPIDSEHSAIWQCLQGNESNEVEKIILTASGGPFRTWTKERILTDATAEAALRHPNWSMGQKITVDCASLMNKGLEVIETMRLFDVPLEKIEILIHPQSVIHSMVRFSDGSVMAQMGLPDMRLPILYALTGPARVATPFARLDFLTCRDLTFEPVDYDKFPCLTLAKKAAETGGSLPAVLNYVNEWAVGRFLSGKMGFYDISDCIDEAFSAHEVTPIKSLSDVQKAEAWAADFVSRRAWA